MILQELKYLLKDNANYCKTIFYEILHISKKNANSKKIF